MQAHTIARSPSVRAQVAVIYHLAIWNFNTPDISYDTFCCGTALLYVLSEHRDSSGSHYCCCCCSRAVIVVRRGAALKWDLDTATAVPRHAEIALFPNVSPLLLGQKVPPLLLYPRMAHPSVGSFIAVVHRFVRWSHLLMASKLARHVSPLHIISIPGTVVCCLHIKPFLLPNYLSTRVTQCPS